MMTIDPLIRCNKYGCQPSNSLQCRPCYMQIAEAVHWYIYISKVLYVVIMLTVKRFFELTSIIPRSKFWQCSSTKCGMWNTPHFTFSSSWCRLSSSNGKAPCTPPILPLTYYLHTTNSLIASHLLPLINVWNLMQQKYKINWTETKYSL